MRYRLGDIRLVPPVVVHRPIAAGPDKLVERPTADKPLAVSAPSVEVVVVPPTRTQEVGGDHDRHRTQNRKDKL